MTSAPTSATTPSPSWPSSGTPWPEAEAALGRFVRTVLRNPWLPHRPTRKQALFLLHDGVEEGLYGGAAGGGKSDALLMAAAQYLHVPGYAALLLRRTYTDLALPGALMDRAQDWWRGKEGVQWDGEKKTFRFPSGATVSFGYLEKARAELRYQSSEFQFIGFDELTQFQEAPYRYLFSRLRKPSAGPLADVPLRMRAGTNPGGPGHEWMKRRFVPDDYLRAPTEERFARPWWKDGRLFVPARLEDNPHVDIAAYERSLAKLDPVTRAQLRKGDMSAHAGGHFKRAWFRTYRDIGDAYLLGPLWDLVHYRDCFRFVTVDPAGGVSEHADPTAMGAWAVTPLRQQLLLDVVRERLAVEHVVPRLARFCELWRPLYVVFETGFLQSAYVREARGNLLVPTVQSVDPGGLSKLVRATPAIIKAEEGGIYLPPEAPWLEDYLAELCAFTGDDKQDAHDDQVDMTAYATLAVDRYLVGPGDDGPVVLGRRRGER